jgi:hypothetical protein
VATMNGSMRRLVISVLSSVLLRFPSAPARARNAARRTYVTAKRSSAVRPLCVIFRTYACDACQRSPIAGAYRDESRPSASVGGAASISSRADASHLLHVCGLTETLIFCV